MKKLLATLVMAAFLAALTLTAGSGCGEPKATKATVSTPDKMKSPDDKPKEDMPKEEKPPEDKPKDEKKEDKPKDENKEEKKEDKPAQE